MTVKTGNVYWAKIADNVWLTALPGGYRGKLTKVGEYRWRAERSKAETTRSETGKSKRIKVSQLDLQVTTEYRCRRHAIDALNLGPIIHTFGKEIVPEATAIGGQ